MKKISVLGFILTLFIFCGPKQDKVEKIIEDGVEVIVNHFEPYRIKGELSNLILEEEFTIDLERDDIARLGLIDIENFNVDSEGNIYILLARAGEGNYFYKFDKDGEFITSFGKRGQGPGEIQSPRYLRINHQDEIEVSDSMRRKLLIFSKECILIKDIPIKFSFHRIISLKNGNYIISKAIFDPSGEYLIQIPLIMYSLDFKEITELGRLGILNYLNGKKVKGTSPIFILDISDSNIFIGNKEREYEIWIFNYEGNLIRKIKKEYREVKIPEEYKKQRLAIMNRQMKKVAYFSKYFPPYKYFFTDENGWLFVMTYEQDSKLKEYIFDIFNPDGIFIGRATFGEFNIVNEVIIECRQNRLYCLREKVSGFKELLAYKMKWE